MKYDKYKCCECDNTVSIPSGSPAPFCRHCGLTMDLVKKRKRENR